MSMFVIYRYYFTKIHKIKGKQEGSVLFDDTFYTFYLQ